MIVKRKSHYNSFRWAALLIVFIAGYFFDSKRVKSEREKRQAELIKMRSIYPDLLLDADGMDKKTGIRYLPIPPGEFMMGYKRQGSDVRPIHSVSVKGFFMSESEVTNEQYRLCVDAGVCTQPHTVKPKCSWGKESYDQYPVNCVTWSQARTFAQWAGGELPTEAQWEYAAREGMNRPKRPTLTSSEEAWYKQNSDGAPHPVKRKKANLYGLYDMKGNLSEWTLDEYHKDYVNAPSNAETAWGELLSCSGVCENKTQQRVHRGGDFNTPRKSIGFYKREYGYKADWQTISIGFRVVKKGAAN